MAKWTFKCQLGLTLDLAESLMIKCIQLLNVWGVSGHAFPASQSQPTLIFTCSLLSGRSTIETDQFLYRKYIFQHSDDFDSCSVSFIPTCVYSTSVSMERWFSEDVYSPHPDTALGLRPKRWKFLTTGFCTHIIHFPLVLGINCKMDQWGFVEKKKERARDENDPKALAVFVMQWLRLWSGFGWI